VEVVESLIARGGLLRELAVADGNRTETVRSSLAQSCDKKHHRCGRQW
jgi:hypothetical protein